VLDARVVLPAEIIRGICRNELQRSPTLYMSQSISNNPNGQSLPANDGVNNKVGGFDYSKNLARKSLFRRLERRAVKTPPSPGGAAQFTVPFSTTLS
jgi:hypothetical protein